MIFLYTFYEYLAPDESYKSIKDKIVILTSGTSTDKFLSKKISSLFYSKESKLLPNEKYYVGAMYAQTLPSGMTVYGEAQISENPVFVPASQIAGLKPGLEVHSKIEDGPVQ